MKISYLHSLFILVLFLSCSERKKDNPLDPNYPGSTSPINLSVLSFDNRIELKWNEPIITDYIGFRLYRKIEETDTSFIQIAELLATTRIFNDYNIPFGKRYNYYITLVGTDSESKPSPVVSIIPGKGYNWVVDKYGYQILKLTYDAGHTILQIFTDWFPFDMAVAKEKSIGLITYPEAGKYEIINLNTGSIINSSFAIARPYVVEYDSAIGHFWLVDSSGYLYKINADNFNATLVSGNFDYPISVSITENPGLINIVDYGKKQIFQLNRAGTIENTISSINGHLLKQPEEFRQSSANGRQWLTDNTGNLSLIYTKPSGANQFTLIDSASNTGNIEISEFNDMLWYVSFASTNSSVVQLSPDGIRQQILSGFYSPWDINVNKYDGTLIIVDTGNSRILHLNNSGIEIGKSGNFNFPVKVVVE